MKITVETTSSSPWKTRTGQKLLGFLKTTVEHAEAANNTSQTDIAIAESANSSLHKEIAIPDAGTQFSAKDNTQVYALDPQAEYIQPPPLKAPSKLLLNIAAAIGAVVLFIGFAMGMYNFLILMIHSHPQPSNLKSRQDDLQYVNLWCMLFFQLVGLIVFAGALSMLNVFYGNILQGKVISKRISGAIIYSYFVKIEGLNRAGKLRKQEHLVKCEEYDDAEVGKFIDLRKKK